MSTETNKTADKDWKTEYLNVLRELEGMQQLHTNERNQNHKLLLQIILSCVGRSNELDERINHLKQELRGDLSEQQRHQMIMDLAGDVPKYTRSEPDSNEKNPFTGFLDELSLPGEIGAEIIRLRKRQQEIQQDQEQLEILKETIDLLKRHYKQGIKNETLLLHLLEHTCLPKTVREDIDSIKDMLLSGHADENELKQTTRKIADVISEVNRSLQTELDQVQAYLTQLMKEIVNIDQFLEQTGQDQDNSYKVSESFNESMKAELDDLQENLVTTDDIDSVRSTIDSHMSKLRGRLDEHLLDAEKRFNQAQERNQELDKKLIKMKARGEKLKGVIRRERQKAHTDALTGIANRLAFDKFIQRELSRCERYGQAFCLAVIDVDKFKSVNDNFGHKAGDKVLKTVAEVCLEHVRESDFLARYGGEEFVVLFPETKLSDAITASEKLRLEVEKCRFHHNDNEVPVTISIGLSEYRTDDIASTLFERADKCLYEAKETGRNRCVSERDPDQDKSAA